MKFSELPGALFPQISPGLCSGLNGRGKYCHLQTLNGIGQSCTYGTYPLSITLKMSDVQIIWTMNVCFEKRFDCMYGHMGYQSSEQHY